MIFIYSRDELFLIREEFDLIMIFIDFISSRCSLQDILAAADVIRQLS